MQWQGLLVTILLLAFSEGCAQSLPSGGCEHTPAGPFGALVFPASGSTAVPVGVGTLVLQGAYFSSSPRAEVTTQSGIVVVDAPIGPPPSPLPSPLATPAGLGGLGYGSVAVPILAAHTTYVVSVTSNCDTSTFGSFSTR